MCESAGEFIGKTFMMSIKRNESFNTSLDFLSLLLTQSPLVFSVSKPVDPTTSSKMAAGLIDENTEISGAILWKEFFVLLHDNGNTRSTFNVLLNVNSETQYALCC